MKNYSRPYCGSESERKRAESPIYSRVYEIRTLWPIRFSKNYSSDFSFRKKLRTGKRSKRYDRTRTWARLGAASTVPFDSIFNMFTVL